MLLRDAVEADDADVAIAAAKSDIACRGQPGSQLNRVTIGIATPIGSTAPNSNASWP